MTSMSILLTRIILCFLSYFGAYHRIMCAKSRLSISASLVILSARAGKQSVTLIIRIVELLARAPLKNYLPRLFGVLRAGDLRLEWFGLRRLRRLQWLRGDYIGLLGGRLGHCGWRRFSCASVFPSGRRQHGRSGCKSHPALCVAGSSSTMEFEGKKLAQRANSFFKE
jgi:hypothetical protein